MSRLGETRQFRDVHRLSGPSSISDVSVQAYLGEDNSVRAIDVLVDEVDAKR
jgi:hypothetical protein